MNLEEAYERWKNQKQLNDYRLSPEVDQTIGAASGINPGIIQAAVPPQRHLPLR